jgi:drug/metabolite transporter (DMT)-like permease
MATYQKLPLNEPESKTIPTYGSTNEGARTDEVTVNNDTTIPMANKKAKTNKKKKKKKNKKVKKISCFERSIGVACIITAGIAWMVAANLVHELEEHFENQFLLLTFIVRFGMSLFLIPVFLFYLYRHVMTEQGELGQTGQSIRWRSSLISQSFTNSQFALKLGGISMIMFLSIYLWYTGLTLSSVSGNTAVYNALPIVVMVFSIIFLGEKFTVAKLVSVILGFTGVCMIAFSSAGGSESQEEAVDHPIGYVFTALAMAAFGLYEVGSKHIEHNEMDHKAAKESGSLGKVIMAMELIGSYGFLSILTLPVLIIMNFLGQLSFEIDAKFGHIALLITMEASMAILQLAAVLFTTPLLFSVTNLLTIPMSMLTDYLFRGYILPPMGLAGAGVILLSFIVMTAKA